MKHTPTRSEFRFDSGLITYIGADGKDCCLGDLMHFPGHGTYDPNFGRIDVSKEEADTHNAVLDKCKTEGLDNQCQVGQGGYAYYSSGRVTSFVGSVLSTHVTTNGVSITFHRGTRVFRGRLSRDHDSFNFRRIA